MSKVDQPTLPYDVAVNPLNGERIEFAPLRGERDGSRLDFRFTLDPGGGVPLAHRHGHQRETLRCLDGEIVIGFEGEERVLRAGETAVVEADVTHTLANRSDRQVVCDVTYEPAGRNEDWFRLAHGFAYVHGREPGLLDLAPFLPDVDILVPRPPARIQRFTVKHVLRPLAIVLGRRRRMLEAAHRAYGRPVVW